MPARLMKAHCQGVNAGGYGQNDYGPAPCGIHGLCVLVLSAQGFVEKLCAHNDKQGTGNPVVPLFYELMHALSQKPADDGHEGLEDAEGRWHANKLACVRALQRDPCGYRDCQSVHGKSHGNGQNFYEIHILSSLAGNGRRDEKMLLPRMGRGSLAGKFRAGKKFLKFGQGFLEVCGTYEYISVYSDSVYARKSKFVYTDECILPTTKLFWQKQESRNCPKIYRATV